MDLIYMNANREDVGVLLDYELDLAFGADENNFECRVQAASHCCSAGYYLYFEGTEYGGIIDNIESDTTTGEVVYSGRTWHGILNSKVIEPDSGEAYLFVNGEANSAIGTLLDRMGLSALFEASTDDSNFTIKNYKMNRYITGYDGIVKMLASVGAKLRVSFRDGVVTLSAVAQRDYSKDEEFDSDQVGMKIKRYHKPVNHLICLGGGELADRLVVHLYADAEGNISRTQTQKGLDEVSAIYDYSAITDEAELVAEGRDKLKEFIAADEVSVDFDSDSDVYDVGDVVGAYDNITGLYISTEIKKKIVTIKNGQVTVSVTPDAAKSGTTQETGGSSGGGSTGGGGADGKDGVSATHEWNGTVLTITSASGTSSADLKGEKGEKGDKGDKGDTGGTGAAGSNGADGVSPTVAVNKSGKVTTVSITDKNGTKTATINDGADGSDGSNGKDGTSVTVKSVSESTADGGSNVVTFSDGKTVTIKNGSKGSTGSKGDKGDKGDTGATGATGAAGKTPVRGTDYWTASDIAEIKSYVDDAILGGAW